MLRSATLVEYGNLWLKWIAHVGAQGVFRRYRGDYIVTVMDIRKHSRFPYWDCDDHDREPYDVSVRSLYLKNASNLMMAGKHISVTHVTESNTKFMGNRGQHAIATAAATHLCKKDKATPREMHAHLTELNQLCDRMTGLGALTPLVEKLNSHRSSNPDVQPNHV
ncbi:hypothetical protein BO86DRAFT_395250 [Aspergillus japonicus CBS 114.51]|uniref:Uncharacterized protein n=1 Tax=Aspergillus japonicus CBS 114.51 TaxID=1448312 RepID=A0A8T8XF92_ASPJA|nr:hypothetical protein BO86DRAFT_395250 [Aspergillus japonicus CBS 114.51]RAH86628.1 hypothetical protein BO86DRAFT_395250 [Aspergillus japonicus CBS 114.51]